MAKERRTRTPRRRDVESGIPSGSHILGIPKGLLLSLIGVCLFLVASSMYLLQPLDDQRLVFLQKGEPQPSKVDISRISDYVTTGQSPPLQVEQPEQPDPEDQEAGDPADDVDGEEVEGEEVEADEDTLTIPTLSKAGSVLPRPVEKELNPKGGKPNAYVNLCVDDKYVFYSIVLFHMLAKVDSHGVFGVMVHNITQENQALFESLGIQVFQSNEIDANLAFSKGSESRDKKLFSKLRVWELDQFEKIVLLDSDMIIVQNIDELFDMPEYTASPLIFPEEKISFYVHVPGFFKKKYQRAKPSDKVVGKFGANSGITVLKPSKETYMELMDILKLVPKRLCCPSQEFLYHFFLEKNQLHPLPFKYHYRMRNRIDKELRRELDKTFKVYHFVERAKPWLQLDPASRTRLAKRWWVHMQETQFMLTGKGVNLRSITDLP